MFSLLAFTANAAPLIEIEVHDPNITEVFLVCRDRTITAPVMGGKAVFDDHVNGCKVEVRSTMGELSSPGRYTCRAGSGCQAQGIIHRAVEDAEGRLNIILTDASADTFELRCGTGYRRRAKVSSNVASFEDVPAEGGCTVFFKGSAPAKVGYLGPGTWKCNALGGLGACKKIR